MGNNLRGRLSLEEEMNAYLAQAIEDRYNAYGVRLWLLIAAMTYAKRSLN